MTSIHLSQARRIMERHEAFSIRFLTKDGEAVDIEKAISLKWDLRTGTRLIKAIPSNQIRRIRDVLILAINDTEVYI